MVKIERSFPSPASLAVESAKKNGSYAKPDVIERLKKDFYNKCYICELKDLQDPQVEHLLPHKNGAFPERKFDWENLFWSCEHCNSVKNQSKYEKGIIDCCKTDPEALIIFHCNDKDVELLNQSPIPNEEVERTIMLIQEVFNLKNTGMRVYKSNLRFKELQKQMNLLFDNLEALKKQPNSKIIFRKLRALLRRDSAFAAFKRCYVREHLLEYPSLSSCLD